QYCWFLSGWLTVAMGTERLFSVMRPLQVTSIFTRRTALASILCLLLLGIPVCLPPNYGVEASMFTLVLPQAPIKYGKIFCSVLLIYTTMVLISTAIRELFCSVLPCVILLLLAIALVVKVKEAFLKHDHPGANAAKAEKKQKKITSTV